MRARRYSGLFLLLTFAYALSQESYQNPVYPFDFPDPFILRLDGTYYAFSSDVGDILVPVLRSEDLATWRWVSDALPDLPAWAAQRSGWTWAPGVLPRGDGFVLYYATREEASGRQCLSRAVSDQPEGPYRDSSTEPFICQVGAGCDEVIGSIDPDPFVDDDGTPYLLWMGAGERCENPLVLYAQRLSEDGLELLGKPTELLAANLPWEQGVVENPDLIKHEGRYYLFYSGGHFLSEGYAVGYALCESPLGPCEKPQAEPVLQSRGDVVGPGGETVFTDPAGKLWLGYHAWTAPHVGYEDRMAARRLYLSRLTFEEGVPMLEGPTVESQP